MFIEGDEEKGNWFFFVVIRFDDFKKYINIRLYKYIDLEVKCVISLFVFLV